MTRKVSGMFWWCDHIFECLEICLIVSNKWLWLLVNNVEKDQHVGKFFRDKICSFLKKSGQIQCLWLLLADCRMAKMSLYFLIHFTPCILSRVSGKGKLILAIHIDMRTSHWFWYPSTTAPLSRMTQMNLVKSLWECIPSGKWRMIPTRGRFHNTAVFEMRTSWKWNTIWKYCW